MPSIVTAIPPSGTLGGTVPAASKLVMPPRAPNVRIAVWVNEYGAPSIRAALPLPEKAPGPNGPLVTKFSAFYMTILVSDPPGAIVPPTSPVNIPGKAVKPVSLNVMVRLVAPVAMTTALISIEGAEAVPDSGLVSPVETLKLRFPKIPSNTTAPAIELLSMAEPSVTIMVVVPSDSVSVGMAFTDWTRHPQLSTA